MTRETPLTYNLVRDLPRISRTGPIEIGGNELNIELPNIYEVNEVLVAEDDVEILGGEWEGFKIPAPGEHMTIVLFNGEKTPACEKYGKRGGTLESRVGVAVMPSDDSATVVDRTRHEILHTMKLPADHMDRFDPAFRPAYRGEGRIQRFLDALLPRRETPIQSRSQFYDWLEELWLNETLGQMPRGSKK